MAKMSKPCDVFIAHSASDAAMAIEIARACRANGLETGSITDIPPGANFSDALWDALAESQALIAILSPSGSTAAMGIEIGAALAWNKPIFGVITDPSSTRVQPSIPNMPLYTFSRLEEIIDAIKRGDQHLSDDDRSLLARTFAEIGTSVDQLIVDSRLREQLLRRFTASAGRTVSEERLLSELMRMRKRGTLNKSRITARTKPRVGST